MAAALVALLVIFVPKLIPVKGIKVSDNTDLSEHTDIMDFAKEQTRLVDEMDDEDVKSGKKRSNRLVVIYEGEGIDLSDFDALWVISDGNGYLLIQFDDSKETDRCLKALKKNKNVISVVEDNYSQMASKAPGLGDLHSSGYPYKSPETGFEYMSWGIEYMGIDKLAAWTMKQKTRSVTVAVLDTGSHPAKGFEDHYLEGIDLVETNNQNGWDDGHGHGTHVAGTVMDCTRGLDVKIMPIRVLNDEGAGASSTIVTGLQIASALKAEVVNMSLGMSGINENACPTGRDPVVERMVANGICVVVSSGNESMDAKESCSGHQDAPIVVGACQPDGTMADFSNYGKSVDVCAPGVEILSFLPDGSLTAWDGTSMAAPHISGLVA
ncbi:MAG: S8 family serine peptidase, partial [Clostridia bacterium]|nr:S8 family serine peptidase [Clostridia bacterium]